MKRSFLSYSLLAIPLVALLGDVAQAGRRARCCCQPCAAVAQRAAAPPATSQPPAVVPPAEKPAAEKPAVAKESLPPIEDRGPLVNPADLKPVR